MELVNPSRENFQLGLRCDLLVPSDHFSGSKIIHGQIKPVRLQLLPRGGLEAHLPRRSLNRSLLCWPVSSSIDEDLCGLTLQTQQLPQQGTSLTAIVQGKHLEQMSNHSTSCYFLSFIWSTDHVNTRRKHRKKTLLWHVLSDLQDRRFSDEIDKLTGYKTKSLLCMPIRSSDGEIIGVAQAINKTLSGELFTEDDEKVSS